MPKKLLIHSLVFSPDGVSNAYLYNDIALKFKERGYDVTVLTSTPHYNVVEEQLKEQPLKWKVPGIYKVSTFHGIKVIHVPQKKFKSTVLRLFGFAYWHIVSFILGLSQRGVDVILSPSPPLTIGLINIWIAKIKRCKVVYNVQEIYPDILNLKKGIVRSALQKLERYIYRKSTCVTAIDQVFYDTIADRFDDPGKLKIIPNFVDTGLYNSEAGRRIKLDEHIFPRTDALKVVYAGNIGFAQDWDILIRLAQKTFNAEIEYYVIGDGVMKPVLEKRRKELKLTNIHILPYQPRELMPAIITYSDVQFIFMSPDMDKQGFPSKVYTILSCAKPILVSSGENTPIVSFLKNLDCAKIETSEDIGARVDDMAQWLTSVSRDTLKEMGLNGEKVIKTQYSKDIVTQQYVDLVDSLT